MGSKHSPAKWWNLSFDEKYKERDLITELSMLSMHAYRFVEIKLDLPFEDVAVPRKSKFPGIYQASKADVPMPADVQPNERSPMSKNREPIGSERMDDRYERDREREPGISNLHRGAGLSDPKPIFPCTDEEVTADMRLDSLNKDIGGEG